MSQAHQRRTGIAVALAVTAAVIAVMVMGGTREAQAARDDPLVLGRGNWSTSTTYLNWQRSLRPMPETGMAVLGVRAGAVFTTHEDYVHGDDTWLDGIRAYGGDRGGYFYGVDSGVVARSEYTGVEADGGDLGVTAAGDTGVQAVGQHVGLDVEGGSLAIQARGAVSFSSAGSATIAGGAASVMTAPGTDIIKGSMVLATAQTPGGQVLRVSRNVTADTIRIHLTAPATQRMTVAYFVIG